MYTSLCSWDSRHCPHRRKCHHFRVSFSRSSTAFISSRSSKPPKSQRVAPVGSPRSVEDMDSSSSPGPSSDEEVLQRSEETPAPRQSHAASSWQHIKLPSCQDAYGFSLTDPNRADAVLYRWLVPLQHFYCVNSLLLPC